MKRIGIIAALPDEANCLNTNKLEVANPIEIQKNIYLCLSGIGQQAAHAATKKILDHNVDALISWGVSGAIDPSLNSGDVLIPEIISFNNEDYITSTWWKNNIYDHLKKYLSNIKAVNILSVNEISGSLENKKDIFSNTGSNAVDMESGTIASIAKSENKEFIALRTVADDANTIIPDTVISNIDHLGRPDLIPVISSCLKHPGQIIDLLKLARKHKRAIHSLTQIAIDLKKHHFLYNI